MIYLLHLNFLLCIINIAYSVLQWWTRIFLPAGRQRVAVSWQKGNNGLGNSDKDYSSSVNCLSCVGSFSVIPSSQCYSFSIYEHKLITLRLDSLHLTLTNWKWILHLMQIYQAVFRQKKEIDYCRRSACFKHLWVNYLLETSISLHWI